jgi:hypothetical protein
MITTTQKGIKKALDIIYSAYVADIYAVLRRDYSQIEAEEIAAYLTQLGSWFDKRKGVEEGDE